MKKYLFFLFVLFAINSYGQAPANAAPNEQSIVKDADGKIYPYAIWIKFVRTGEYSLRRTVGSTEFLLVRLTEEQKAANAEKRKAMQGSMAKPQASPAFKEGEKFRAERIMDMNGNKFDLKNNKDKIYVLNFWFINCPPCKQEIPELNELVRQYKDNKDVVFLAIALDDKTQLKEFLKTMPFTYNVVDDGGYLAQKHGVTAYPTHVVIGKDGLIKFSTLGLASNTVYWVEKTIKEQISL